MPEANDPRYGLRLTGLLASAVLGVCGVAFAGVQK